MTKPLMKCGHAANATHGKNGAPCCVICAGIDAGAYIEAETKPNLTGRTAVCGYNCGAAQPSALELAFFEYRPDKATDAYYCGCKGWG